MRKPAFLLFIIISSALSAQSFDWPMWRYDAGRSASTPEQLPDKLYLQWQISFSPRTPVWDDPLNQNLMQFDRLFEPIVAGDKIFLGFNDQDKVIALQLNTGKEIWHFYADGPVRLPLAFNKGKLYFTGDDGYCYCLDANTGKLAWKLLLAPAKYKILGNQRLISMWPARGGIVIKDNILYTAASIFPLMGTYIYAIDPETGDIIWKNDGTSSNYILQPHRSPAFADIAPQGAFTVSGNRLLVAGGRTVPAAFNMSTGEELYYLLAESGKTGGSFTCSNDKVFFNHNRGRMTFMFDSQTGGLLKSDAGEYPVVDGDTIYFSGKKITAAILDKNKKLVPFQEIDIPATNDLIKAGNRLYAADSSGITAINVREGDTFRVDWSVKCDKTIERLLASNGKLIAVTDDGTVLVYGGIPVENVTAATKSQPGFNSSSSKASELIKDTGLTDGYAVVYGTDNLDLVEGLLQGTSLSFIIFDRDQNNVNRLREKYDEAGIKSQRLSFLKYDESKNLLPKYFTSLTLIDKSFFSGVPDKSILNQIFESTRPYGGKILVNYRNRKAKKYIFNELSGLTAQGAEINSTAEYLIITRVGSLKGSDNWTHAYGNIANTVKSDDDLVKAPLGILWFGGNSNLDVLPRHGHGPSEQVIDGRLIIEGINSISARDVYTGRLLWKRVMEDLKTDNWLVYYDETYDGESPLDTKYNQIHLPGSNSRGTNFIATKEYVYVIEGNKCQLLDVENGSIVKTFITGEESTEKLGYIGVYKDFLILGNNFTDYPEIEVPLAKDEKPPDPKFESFDVTASRELLILNRFTGEKIWRLKSNHGFIHNSIIAGDDMLFCLDKLPQSLETKLRRRGEALPDDSRLLYIDIRSGKVLHDERSNVFGSWLGYSEEYKYLLQATRPSRDMLSGEDGKRMILYNVPSGEIIWDKQMSYINPPIIHNDKIYTEGAAFSLLTGDPFYETDPVTGEQAIWSFKREYGCGYIVASENLLTFRSASAAFVNLNTVEGTASLGGFKAGCSANLIVADGVLNAPDYTRTCQCPYQNQTSLAFIYLPWMNYWTNSNYKWSGKRIRQIGLNLNAPGDRVSADNTLWLDYPNVGGASPELMINVDTSDYYIIRKDPLSVKSDENPWISSSAIGGIRSMEITLSKDENIDEEQYTVNLYFAELANAGSGERVFDVAIQGEKVLDGFDIIRESGEADREIVKSFKGIRAGNKLKIDLLPEKGTTLLSGIELKLEAKPIN